MKASSCVRYITQCMLVYIPLNSKTNGAHFAPEPNHKPNPNYSSYAGNKQLNPYMVSFRAFLESLNSKKNQS